MPEIARPDGDNGSFELEFVEQEATPPSLMKLSIQLHAAGLSLSNTVSTLEEFGIDRAPSTVHKWVQKADLQPTDGRSPYHVAVDETLIQLNNQRFWLSAAVDPDTTEFPHVKHLPARTNVLTKRFLQELAEKHEVTDTVFLVDGAHWLHAALYELDLQFRHVTHGNRNSVERLFKEIKRRTEQFDNHFRHATTESAENW